MFAALLFVLDACVWRVPSSPVPAKRLSLHLRTTGLASTEATVDVINLGKL